MKRRPLVVAILLACTIALAACNSEDPRPSSSASRTPSPSSALSTSPAPSPTKPLTPAEQDMLSAGEAVTQYWRIIDEVASNPKVSLNVLATVARSQALEQWQTTLSEFRAKQWTQEGVSVVRDIDPSTDGESFTVAACVNVAELDVVDRSGKSVVVDSRPVEQRFTYKVVKAPEGFFVTEDTLKGKPCVA
jgi:hypothetical protein